MDLKEHVSFYQPQKDGPTLLTFRSKGKQTLYLVTNEQGHMVGEGDGFGRHEIREPLSFFISDGETRRDGRVVLGQDGTPNLVWD